ncbi:MAG: sialidase family protein [Planctomycetaceae bacterium]
MRFNRDLFSFVFPPLVVALMVAMQSVPSASAGKPEIISVKKIWDRGKHNAFTDLIRFRDRFYCVFRESEAHVGGDGKLRVLVSQDGDHWKSAALIAEKGIDLRDPKLSITPDNQLMIVAGGSVYRGGTKILGRQPRVMFSKNGKKWTPPLRVLEEGDWLWRVTWRNGIAYGVSYRTAPPKGQSAKSSDWLLVLYKSSNGKKWERVTELQVPNRPNETTLRFLPDGKMVALVRREAGNRFGWIGTAEAPYKKWNWTETRHRLGGPNFIRLPDGKLWAGSRSYPGGAKTVLASMTTTEYKPVLTLPSGGDTSYPGLVWHEGVLWMSYYSSHQGKTSIYLAKIRLN